MRVHHVKKLAFAAILTTEFGNEAIKDAILTRYEEE